MNINANENQVRAIAEPEFTKSWHPVSHARVIDATEAAVAAAGMEIRSKHYTLAAKGKEMFASWVLNESHVAGTNYMIGFRNALNMMFAVGFAGGNHVTVCSNMMFSGEFVTFRKHTSGLDDELLKVLAGQAVDTVVQKTKLLVDWQEGLKEIPMDLPEFKQLTFDAMEAEIIMPSSFAKFVDCHTQEMKDQKADGISLSTFHGGVTRLVREKSLFNIANVTGRLKGFCDDYKLLKAA